MKVWTKVVYQWDDAAGEYVIDETASESHDYEGPVALCKKDMAAPSADPAIGQAALANIELGKEWLRFSREQFDISNMRQENIDALTLDVTKQQLKDSKLASERSTDQYNRYTRLFQPIEDRIVKDAMEYDSPAKQAAAAAAAKADVLGAAQDAESRNARQMAAMGINPTSGRFAGIDRATDLDTALASAGAQNNAREQVKMTGMALREGAANMGRGATSTSAQQASIAQSGGNAAVGNTLQANSAWQGNNNIMASGFQGGISANSSGAGILNQQYQNDLSAYNTRQQANASNVAGIASALGTGAGLFLASSKDYKEGKEPVDGALDALESMPVEQWTYKAGIGDGGHHIGPYAEDFKAATGKGDGKSIPLQDMVGVTMKAVQELNAKVDKIAERQGE